MAIRKLESTKALTPREAKLKASIESEIRRPESRPPPGGAPVVFVEDGSFPKTKHYYVVSDLCAGIDTDRRSEILLDAIEETQGKEAVLEVTLAIGLTRHEAKEMGLPIDRDGNAPRGRGPRGAARPHGRPGARKRNCRNGGMTKTR